MDKTGRKALHRILLAYAWHNPNVGYCQVLTLGPLIPTSFLPSTHCLDVSFGRGRQKGLGFRDRRA